MVCQTCALFVVCCSLLAVCYSSTAARCSLFVVYCVCDCWFVGVCRSLCVVRRAVFVVCCSLCIVRGLFFVV